MGLRNLLVVSAVALVTALAAPADARSLRFANTAELPGLDPHTRTDAPTLSFLLNIYETLVRRDGQLNMEPALAVSWSNPSPTVWRFELRPNVRWQDGTPLTAEDVVFSYQRASNPRAQSRVVLTGIREVRAVGPLTVEFETANPDPLLPARTYAMAIMNKAWAERGQATEPADFAATGSPNAALRQAMGTGPFMVRTFEPGRPAVAVPNPNWWGRPEHNLTEVTYVAIPNDATRTAALLSGEIDVNLNLPPQDVARVRAQQQLRVVESPEMRTIFLYLDVARDELQDSNIKGRNPLRDVRVRRAMYHAIDIETIRRTVMRNQSAPTGLMWGPGTNGYTRETDTRLPYDPARARALLAEAGYPDGFEIGFDCPNDRYLNDEETCRALVGMFARVGIRVQLNSITFTRLSGKLFPNYNTSMALFGWFPLGTYDAGNPLAALMACRNRERNRGFANVGGWCNPAFDALVDEADREMNPTRRLELITQAARVHQDDVGQIPLHHTYIIWGTKANVTVTQRPDNFFLWRFIRVN